MEFKCVFFVSCTKFYIAKIVKSGFFGIAIMDRSHFGVVIRLNQTLALLFPVVSVSLPLASTDDAMRKTENNVDIKI